MAKARRTSSQHDQETASGSPANVMGRVIASINRALWGEVSSKLRSVQFKVEAARISLRFFYEGAADDADRDSVASVGGEVAADFPECAVSEETIATNAAKPIEYEPGWQAAFARKERSLVR